MTMTLNPLGRPVRTFVHGGQTYFHLSDIAALLHIRQQKRATDSLDQDEFITLDQVTGDAKDASVLLLAETAIYKIAIRMHSPFGRAMLRYVSHALLPEMRASGSVRLPSANEASQGAALVTFLREMLANQEPSESAAK